VEPTPGQFVSRIFSFQEGRNSQACSKPEASQQIHFQETLQDRGHSHSQGADQGARLDDVSGSQRCISICSHPHDSQELLCFQWQGEMFEFQCLPFGLISAPRVFTKLMKPVMAVLRRQGIQCMIFIDDILLLSQSREELASFTSECVASVPGVSGQQGQGHSDSLPIHGLPGVPPGFRENVSPSSGGEAGGSHSELCYQPQEDTCDRPRAGKGDREDVSHFTGNPSSPPLLQGSSELEECSIRVIQRRSCSGLGCIPGSHMVGSGGQALEQQARQADVVIDSDASLLGWGASTGEVATGGLWTPSERCYHINSHPGDDGRELRSEDLCKGHDRRASHTTQDGHLLSHLSLKHHEQFVLPITERIQTRS